MPAAQNPIRALADAASLFCWRQACGSAPYVVDRR